MLLRRLEGFPTAGKREKIKLSAEQLAQTVAQVNLYCMVKSMHVPAPLTADPNSLEALFREHNSWLIRWVRSHTKSQLSAEDIAAEVFLRLLTMGNLAAVREPRAMMVTIARRLSIELFRRNHLQKSYEAELRAQPAELSASPEHQAIVVEALREIGNILSTMSPRARAAFLMSQVDGMTYSAIATEVGVSITMVRKYVAQGLLRFYQYHPDR